MAKIGYLHNGTAKRKNSSKTTAKNSAKNGTAKRKNSLTMARVKTFLAKNGQKMVARGTSQNPKRRKKGRRRNGLQPVSRSRNGLFGNTKQDVKQVGFLAAGAAITKGLGRIISGFVSPHLARMGFGNYSTVLADGAVALLIVPFIGQKTFGKDAATFGRLGGLFVTALDAVQVFAPDTLAAYNPFVDFSPVIVTNGKAAITPEATAAIAAEVANSPNPRAEAAKVAGAMNALSAGQPMSNYGGYGSGSEDYIPNMMPELVV